jgi:hypothetical protein
VRGKTKPVPKAHALQPRPRVNKAKADLAAALDLDLKDGRLVSYAALAKWLADKNWAIVEARPRFAGGSLERKLGLVRLVTQQATAVIEASPDADNNLSAALLRLVQQHLFEMLVDLKTHGLTQKDIAKLAETVAQMTRASVMQQKWASDLKSKYADRVDAAQQALIAEAQEAANTGGGLSTEAETRIRRILMEIAE